MNSEPDTEYNTLYLHYTGYRFLSYMYTYLQVITLTWNTIS